MIDSTRWDELSPELIDQVKAGNCIVFAGSDLSIPSSNQLGPPSPALLALELALQLGGQFEDYSLPWIAQYYVDHFDTNKLRKFVVDRLDTTQYAPNQVHFLLVKLQFPQIVYLSQDNLLREAYRICNVQVNHVLGNDESLTLRATRRLIQPYGSVVYTETLRLTEDERRSVFENRPKLARFLRNEIYLHPSVFLGCSQGDPDFREFFYSLRPETDTNTPRSYIVQADIKDEDRKYWTERNAETIQADAFTFLQKMAVALSVPMDELGTAHPINEAERLRREQVILDFSQQLGLGRPVENRAQLQSIAIGVATLRQAWGDHKRTGTIMVNEMSSNQNFDARLILQEGNMEWAEGNWLQAREAFEKAIRMDPNLIDAHVSLHHLLVETGDMDAAMKVYEQIIKLDATRAFIPPRYELLEILGQNNVGIVYHCTDKAQEKEVVLTILRRALSHQTKVVEEFEKQVKILKSSRINQLLELNSFHAQIYIVTEYFKANSLRKVLDDQKYDPTKEKMTLFQIFKIVEQIMEALEVGEQQGVPHLALRPQNILLTDKGVVLINYGFSELAHALRRSGRDMDRPWTEYEAPEQKGQKEGDKRSDIYALGTILYEMLMGWTPGRAELQSTVGEVYPQVGEALDVLINHTRAYDPDKRFQTVNEVKKEIHRISLSTGYRGLNQYTRIVLAGISKFYALLLSRRGNRFTFGIVLLLLVLGSVNINVNNLLMYGIRATSLFIITSLATSSLGYYVVRELSRVRGLGSLINSGRGMGAILGLLITAYLLRTTNWGDSGGLSGVLGSDFLGYLLNCLAVGILISGGQIIVIHLAGRVFEKRRNHYTLGFYAGFLIISAILAVLVLKGPPPYIIKW